MPTAMNQLVVLCLRPFGWSLTLSIPSVRLYWTLGPSSTYGHPSMAFSPWLRDFWKDNFSVLALALHHGRQWLQGLFPGFRCSAFG